MAHDVAREIVRLLETTGPRPNVPTVFIRESPNTRLQLLVWSSHWSHYLAYTDFSGFAHHSIFAYASFNGWYTTKKPEHTYFMGLKLKEPDQLDADGGPMIYCDLQTHDGIEAFMENAVNKETFILFYDAVGDLSSTNDYNSAIFERHARLTSVAVQGREPPMYRSSRIYRVSPRKIDIPLMQQFVPGTYVVWISYKEHNVRPFTAYCATLKDMLSFVQGDVCLYFFLTHA